MPTRCAGLEDKQNAFSRGAPQSANALQPAQHTVRFLRILQNYASRALSADVSLTTKPCALPCRLLYNDCSTTFWVQNAFAALAAPARPAPPGGANAFSQQPTAQQQAGPRSAGNAFAGQQQGSGIASRLSQAPQQGGGLVSRLQPASAAQGHSSQFGSQPVRPQNAFSGGMAPIQGQQAQANAFAQPGGFQASNQQGNTFNMQQQAPAPQPAAFQQQQQQHGSNAFGQTYAPSAPSGGFQQNHHAAPQQNAFAASPTSGGFSAQQNAFAGFGGASSMHVHAPSGNRNAFSGSHTPAGPSAAAPAQSSFSQQTPHAVRALQMLSSQATSAHASLCALRTCHVHHCACTRAFALWVVVVELHSKGKTGVPARPNAKQIYAFGSSHSVKQSLNKNAVQARQQPAASAQHGQRVAFEVPQEAVAQSSAAGAAPVTEDLQQLWQAKEFELGKIPESAPPPEVC